MVFLATAAGGCAPPVVTIRHTLPADLPVGAGRAVHVEPFVLGAPAPGDLGGLEPAKAVAAMLTERLAPADGHRLAASSAEAELIVSGTLYLHADQTTGRRAVRRYNARRRRTEVVDVPTLTRTATARVDFVIRDVKAGGQYVAETRRSYNSAGDPRTRGPRGLDRADQPAHVPATEAIVRELLTGCVETFWQMIQPRQIAVDVPLRAVGGAEGHEGLTAAAGAGYDKAVEAFAAAASAQPDSADVLFNLAVCAERAGDLNRSLGAYEKVVALTRGADVHAAHGAARVRRALAAQN